MGKGKVLSSLPDEVMWIILCFLDFDELISLSTCNSTYYNAIIRTDRIFKRLLRKKYRYYYKVNIKKNYIRVFLPKRLELLIAMSTSKEKVINYMRRYIFVCQSKRFFRIRDFRGFVMYNFPNEKVKITRITSEVINFFIRNQITQISSMNKKPIINVIKNKEDKKIEISLTLNQKKAEKVCCQFNQNKFNHHTFFGRVNLFSGFSIIFHPRNFLIQEFSHFIACLHCYKNCRHSIYLSEIKLEKWKGWKDVFSYFKLTDLEMDEIPFYRANEKFRNTCFFQDCLFFKKNACFETSFGFFFLETDDSFDFENLDIRGIEIFQENKSDDENN